MPPIVERTESGRMDEVTTRALFRGKDRLNCIQAMLKAFQPVSGVSDEVIGSFAKLGKGKVNGGVCGALYAAEFLLDDPDAVRDLEREFEAAAGSTICKRIRKGKKLSCGDCVALAARFVREHRERHLQNPNRTRVGGWSAWKE